MWTTLLRFRDLSVTFFLNLPVTSLFNSLYCLTKLYFAQCTVYNCHEQRLTQSGPLISSMSGLTEWLTARLVQLSHSSLSLFLPLSPLLNLSLSVSLPIFLAACFLSNGNMTATPDLCAVLWYFDISSTCFEHSQLPLNAFPPRTPSTGTVWLCATFFRCSCRRGAQQFLIYDKCNL